MAPPRGRGRGRVKSGRGRGGGSVSRGGARSGGKSKEDDPNNDQIYTKVDKFHMEKDKISFDGGDSDSDDSDESEQEEAVMDIEGEGDSGSSGDSDEDSDDSDLSDLPELPEHVRRVAMEAASSDDDSDDENDSNAKVAAGWGKKRSAYYNADTADLEIGQEFEDAEAEEEAALELQRASYKRLDPADFGEEEEENGQDEDGGVEGGVKKRKGERRRGEGGGGAALQGEGAAALLSMKSDLEQIALGASGEVETSVVKRDTSKLSRRDKLELVLSESPELPHLLGEVKGQLEVLVNTVQPLVSNVTADLGASQDGLDYLRTRQQLLLGYCMNVCFYMLLKARGEPAKGHPVMRRLLSLREIIGDMSALDDKVSSQVDLLLRALAEGVDLAGSGADANGSDASNDDGDEADDDTGDFTNGMVEKRAKNGRTAHAENSEAAVDYQGVEEEEARFMGKASDDSEDEIDQSKLSAAEIKKRKKKARKRALAEAKATLALGQGGNDDALGHYGDDDVDDDEAQPGSGRRSNGNLLQSMVNRISQREQAVGRKKGLDGDLDVPIRERDQTIRVRRPAPGGSDSEDVGDGDGNDDSGEDDLGFGDDGGFMEGLPPGLIEQLSRDGRGLGRKKQSKEKRRREAVGDEGDGDGEGVEDGFYAAVAEEKARKKLAKKEKYTPEARIAGALEAELEAERAARAAKGGSSKRGASYSIIKNRGLTPHKNKLNRNPRAKKREAFRKATIRRKGQVREVRTNEADAYGGESTGIRANVTRGRHLKG